MTVVKRGEILFCLVLNYLTGGRCPVSSFLRLCREHPAPSGRLGRFGPVPPLEAVPTAVLAAVLMLSGCSQSDDALDPAVLAPPGLSLPYVAEGACPGEGCTYGNWLACGHVPLLQTYLGEAVVLDTLTDGDTIEVATGVVVVDVPEVVVVTGPVERLTTGGADERFQPNDTVYVLDYLGEGFFSAWHAGTIVDVEVFWPWENLYVGPDFEFAGEVVQQGRSSFWIRAAAPSGTTGWLKVDDADLAIPNSLDPRELACR